MPHAKLAFFLIILISTPTAYVIITRASSDPPNVILRFGNYQSSPEQTIVGFDDGDGGYVGINVTFAAKLSFTVTNVGNETSQEFLIFVNPQTTKWTVPANPLKLDFSQVLRKARPSLILVKRFSEHEGLKKINRIKEARMSKRVER